MSLAPYVTELMENEVTSSTTELPQWDVWGLVLSGVCLVHCLLTPLALVVLPAFVPHWLQAEGHGHGLFFLLLLPVAVFAMVSGFRRHHLWPPVIWLAFGVLVVGIATFIFDGTPEYLVTIVGSLVLLRGHYLNRRCCQSGCAPRGAR